MLEIEEKPEEIGVKDTSVNEKSTEIELKLEKSSCTTVPDSSANEKPTEIEVKSEKNPSANVQDSSTNEKPTEVEVKLEKNPYAYLEREEFSSEKFKIIIKNLPKFYGVYEIRKLINDKLKLASNKIKFIKRNSPIIFVCFRSEEDRDNAIKTINNFTWKGNRLVASEARPAPDPLVKRRNEESDDSKAKRSKLDDRPQEERLRSSTTPLWNVPYEEQLKEKQGEIKNILKKLGNDLYIQNPSLRSHLDKQKKLYGGLPCELLDIRYSEKLEGYRNKCEFSIGEDEETKLPTVGFRVGSYAIGKTGVAPVEGLQHISDKMKVVARVCQDFVRSYDLPVFNPEFQTGNFRQLTVRSSSEQLMIIVGVHPQNLTDEQLVKLKGDLIEYFFKGAGKVANVTSLFYQAVMKKTSNDDVNVAEHLHGDAFIQENILGLTFRISPSAFFQINTSAAEIVYSSAIELAKPNLNSTVVDICCGTGTIGLCFAKTCGQVLGVEIVPQAVEDAKQNAKLNGIENCEFFAGKAEEILTSVLYRAKNEDVIAVVDPPRAGLHLRGIAQLRKTKKLNKLLYISCNASAAMKNFVDLGRPDSKTMHGEPFIPVKALAVDMFPYTKHCELLIYFERWVEEESKESSSVVE